MSQPVEQEARIIDLLEAVARQAYWYGEDTGDYGMSRVGEQTWFKSALADLCADQVAKKV